jgi:Golgi SNAP receptor complex protein 1
LSNVRGEISSYRDRAGQAEAEYMLEERGRVDNSNNMADSILAQAYAVNDSFAQQRETLASIQRRITGAAAMVPGVNTLIGKISAKKRRDALILGSFMGVVCLLFLYFM